LERSQKIRIWMRLLFVLFIVSFLGTIIFYYGKSNYQMVVAREREDLNMFTKHLELNINTRLMSMQLLAANPRVRRLEPEMVYKELAYSAKTLKFSNMGVFDSRGILIKEVRNKDSASLGYDKENLHRALAGKPVITDVITSNTSPASVDLYIPIYDDNNHVKAVLAGGIVLDELAQFIEEDMFPVKHYLFIEDNQNKKIYYPGIKNKEDCHENKKIDFNQQSGSEVDKLVIYNENQMYIVNIMDNSNWRIIMRIPINEIYIIVLKKSAPHMGLLLLIIICAGLLYRNFTQDRCCEENMRRFRMERLMSVNQLAAGLAHEIRNPLTSIKGFIQLMMIKKDIVPNQSHVQIILDEIDRIDKLVHEFQRLTHPLKTPHFVKIDIEQMIQEVIILMEGQAVKKNLILTFSNNSSLLAYDYVELGEGPVLNRPFYVWGDEDQLKQVIINLVKNAIDAVDKNGEIVIRLSIKDKIALIAIRDNGSGMSQEVLEKIGTPFFTTKDSGNGLGLSVCYNIIGAHGGTIEVNSEAGIGTVFTVKLPCLSKEGRL
jgi:signal transduction histidine kinase